MQILELPYDDQEMSMLILLPRKKDGLAEVENSLTVASLKQWTGNLPRARVQVFLPRFELTCGFTLNQALTAMGMTDAFDMDKADFSDIDGNRHWLFLGAVFHKAFIAVDEEGTEAAAATVIGVQRSGLSAPPPIFRADHPFLFLIRENITGSILFLGRVVDPSPTAG